jgi:hypothetical protein
MLRRVFVKEVGDADDAHKLIAVHDGQGAEFVGAEHFGGAVGGGIRRDGDGIGRHTAFGNQGVQKGFILPAIVQYVGRVHRQTHVAVGDDAYEAIALIDNGKLAAAIFLHAHEDGTQRGIDPDGDRAKGHEITYSLWLHEKTFANFCFIVKDSSNVPPLKMSSFRRDILPSIAFAER